MPLLIIEKGNDKGKSIPLSEGRTVLIGRDSSTALPLRDTMTSRMHFKIESREDGFYLHDLESMNGTYLNGTRVRGEPVKLNAGDLIKAGETFFTFQSEDAGTSTLSGERMGGYRIIERIGRGGMGTVYKAEQVDLQRVVALKVISEEHTKDKDYLDLFIHEARAAAKLNHPNIVQVYDVKRHGELYYFSMEYVSGGSVQDILNKKKNILVDQAVQMILDAARGLDYAHKKGIIHRDVKPDNFMISETGAIKIGDMGLARGLNEKIGPEEETSVIGTPHYIAPEQVLGRPADFRSDIYSLGATMYRMLSGVTPFSAASVRDLVNRKVREEAPPVTEQAPEVPKALSEILARMMARDPERRFQSMAEVVASLERFQRGQVGTGEIRREHSTAIETIVQNKKLFAGAAAVILLVLLGGAYAIFRESPKPPDVRPAGPNLELADHKLDLARLRDRQLKDRGDTRELQNVIDEYDSIVNRFPGTEVAAKATEERDARRKELRQVRAAQKLRLAEAEDRKSWQKFTQSFQTKKPDLAPVDEAIAAYGKVATEEDTKQTAGADQASARAAHIQRWKKLFQDERDEFDKVIQRAQALLSLGHWRDAQQMYLGFEDFCRKAQPECDFAKDRWKDLFYDEAAGKEAQGVVAEAKAAWARIEQEARVQVRDRNYESALKMVDAVLKDSVDEVTKDAKSIREGWQSEWDALVRKDREDAATAAAADLERARAAFGEASLTAHKLVKDFDFKGALLKMRTLRDANQAEELKSRLDRRVLELERAVHFKDSLISAIKTRDPSGVSPFRFKREILLDKIEASIEDADDRSIKISPSGGGTVDRSWSQQFDGAAFYSFVKKQWKYNAQQDSDLNDRCDLAAVCMEFGLYEEAIEEIRGALTEALKNPASQPTDPVRKFCEDYLVRIPKAESAEFSEIEAQKRLDRLETFMKAAAYARARNEIDILRGRYYGRTQRVVQANSRIEDCLAEIARKGGEEINKVNKEQKYQKILDRVAEEQGAMRKAQTDIVSRLNRIDDAFQRNMHLGAVYAAVIDFRNSLDRFLEAKRIGEGMLARKEVGPEFWPSLEAVYGELFRNAVLSKDKAKAQSIKNEGSARFVDPINKTSEEKGWAELRRTLEDWSENSFPQEEKRVVRLRDEVRANSDDPQRIWALAVCLMDSLGNLFEARGYFAYLLDNHHEFAQVANGNCLYRLAEIHFAAREIPLAIKRYEELKAQNKDNPKVQDANSPTGVRRRLEESYRLFNRMGYSRDRAGK